MQPVGSDVAGAFVKGRAATNAATQVIEGGWGVFELLEMNDDMLDALRRGSHGISLQQPKEQILYSPGVERFELCPPRLTSLDEVFPVVCHPGRA